MWGNRKSMREGDGQDDNAITLVAAGNEPFPSSAGQAATVGAPVATPSPTSAFPPPVGSAATAPMPDIQSASPGLPASPFPQNAGVGAAAPAPGSAAGSPLSINNASTQLGGTRPNAGTPQESTEPANRGRWLPLLLALAFLVTAIVSFLLGRVSSDTESASGAAGPRPVPADQPAVEDEADPADAPAGPVDVTADEPVVAVAEAVAPTVVQLVVPGPGGVGGLGSGFFYDDDGRILTNAHVVGDAEVVLVRLASGTQVEGRVVGADEVSDVAVVQVDEVEGTTPAALADGVPIKVGQLAVVLGSPFGLEQTVTSGIVSAINRPLRVDPTSGTPPQAMIQTDASINQGNSGGPLVDRQGRVIGINSAIFSRSGTADGVGFAIPIDRALDIADFLVRGIEIERGLLGVGGNNPVTGRAGALITQVTPGSGADDGGIEVGDLIIKVDERDIRSINDLGAVIRARQAGDEVRLEFVRDGVELESTVTLGSE